MFYKKSPTFLFALGAFSINQSNAAQTSHNFDGPYLGIGAAYLTATSQLDQQVNGGIIESNLKMAGQAPQVSLFAGYGRQMNSPLYLGFEGKFAHTNYQGKYTSHRSINRSINFEIKDSYSILGKLGWNIKDTALIYTKAGLCTSGMRLGAQDTTDDNFTITTPSKKRVNGFELGFGVDFSVHSNLLVGAEFTHCHYQSMRVKTIETQGTAETAYKIQPQTNAVGLRLTWKI